MDPVPRNAGAVSARIAEILDRHSWRRDALVAMLHDIQREVGFLPHEALVEIAQGLDIPISKVYGVATFYTLFSMEPKGEHVIRVCENAPCHVLGAQAIVEALERTLGVPMGGTTADRRFTLEFTSCLGVCGVAPAIMIDDAVYGNVTPERIPLILKEYC